jgi:hypothetical protein
VLIILQRPVAKPQIQHGRPSNTFLCKVKPKTRPWSLKMARLQCQAMASAPPTHLQLLDVPAAPDLLHELHIVAVPRVAKIVAVARRGVLLSHCRVDADLHTPVCGVQMLTKRQ